MSARISFFLLAGGALVASCSTATMRESSSPAATQELASALAGRTAGKPVSCIPSYQADRMQIIDDQTILFRNGSAIYLQRTNGSCNGIGMGSNTLVTRVHGTNQLCSGDIQRVVNLSTGVDAGSCVFGPFVPYTRR